MIRSSEIYAMLEQSSDSGHGGQKFWEHWRIGGDIKEMLKRI